MVLFETYNFAKMVIMTVNPLNAELNPICHLLVLLGAHHILHVSGMMIKSSRSFSVFISVAEKHFTISEGINQL